MVPNEARVTSNGLQHGLLKIQKSATKADKPGVNKLGLSMTKLI
jgi:hypothetical protein